MSDDSTKPQPGTIRVDEEQLQGHVDQAVRTIGPDPIRWTV